jgi:hypothetical protein
VLSIKWMGKAHGVVFPIRWVWFVFHSMVCNLYVHKTPQGEGNSMVDLLFILRDHLGSRWGGLSPMPMTCPSKFLEVKNQAARLPRFSRHLIQSGERQLHAFVQGLCGCCCRSCLAC